MKKITFFLLAIVFTISSFAQTEVLNEDFNGCALPAGWSTDATDSAYASDIDTCGSSLFSFDCLNGSTFSGDPNANFSGCIAVINDDDAGSGFVGTGYIYSPVMDLSDGGVNLSFDYTFDGFGSAAFDVEVWDGAVWTSLFGFTGTDDDQTGSGTVSIATYSNADFQVRFAYNDGGSWNWGVGIDNVIVTKNNSVVVGNAPVINCPGSPVTADSDAGACGAVVNFAVSAVDIEDGGLTPTQTMGDPSGSVFPVGTTPIEFSVTDSDGNTVTCGFDIVVTDIEAPVAVCQDYTVALGGAGTASITPADIDNGSSDNCDFTLSLDNTSFSCGDVGANTVTLTVTDASGNTDTCTATVTVEDNQAPIIMCKGGGGAFNVLEEFEATTIPSGWSTEIINGTYDWTFGSGDMSGTGDFPTNAAIFDDDAAGNTGVPNAAVLFSPVYSLAGADSAELSFDYALGDLAGNGFLWVFAFDGTDWNPIFLADDADIDPVNSGVIDMMPYANANFQVAFLYDDENGGWNWSAGVDNFTLNYNIPPIAPLEVDLMADGTVSVPAGDLLFSVVDNCNYTVGAGGATTGSLVTTFDAGNGFSGNMFDLKAVSNVTINSFDVHLEDGITDDVEVWARTGSYVGFEDSNAGWTLLATASGVVSNGSGNPTPLNLDLGYEMAAGETHAFYVTTTLGGTMAYTNGGTAGDLFANDDNIEFYEGAGGGYFAVDFSPRVFNGNINYTAGAAAMVDLDCSNVGENSIDVIVTDAGGNEATCTATVIVNDVTAPVLVCGPEPILFDSGSASISPAATIDTNSSDVTITSVINIADDFDVADINVVLDVTHTYIGDLQITLTSPAGTSILLFGGLCGPTQNLLLTFDDEGNDSSSLTCGDLQSGTNIDLAAILGYDPLSTFDGESLMGDWTLTIEDTWPGLDGGMLNSWGIDYEYSYPNPSTDLNIELDATGNYTIGPDDILTTQEEACGIDVILTDVTDVDCSDIGTPIMVTVFANDASGNFASCQYEVNVVDTMAPVLTCPGNLVEGTKTGTYTIPDYIANEDTYATDNCTDAANITLTQTPAPGTVYGITVGTANPPIDVIFTATDANGNEAVCQFELEIQDATGVNENTILDGALEMFPNPATQSVTLRNNSQFTIDTAMVYDINGKLVKQVDLQTSMSFDVSHLDAGVYMVKIIGDDATAVKRLIVE